MIRAELTNPKETPVNNEGLKGDESNAILHAMDAALKLTTAKAEFHNYMQERVEETYSHVSLGRKVHKPELVAQHKKKKAAKRVARQSEKHAAFFRYSYYDVAFKYLIEHALGAHCVTLPPRTKQTIEVGSRYSSDYVCTPFKHLLGDYKEALDAGADVIVTMAGPCRLGYYGEVHESILRDLGYEFTTLNFSELRGVKEYIEKFKAINPALDVPYAIRSLLTLVKMVEDLDEAWAFFIANGGFEVEPGSFDAAWRTYYQNMYTVVDDDSLAAVHDAGMAAFRALPVKKPDHPIRVGIVGELYTAVDEDSNLHTERKFMKTGVELHRAINLTTRYLNYNEVALRATAPEYLRYDMGITSTLTIASAKSYAEQGFDGIVHIKSAGCTPEIDCIPVLQEISHDYHVPTLYLTFDAQTSDAGLDTRIEAFYDMLAMKKGKAAL